MNDNDDAIDMFVIVLLLIILGWSILAGCATDPRTPEEIECQRAVELENWTLCEQVYKDAGRYTIHRDHLHPAGKPVKWYYIQSDLSDNFCRMILGPYYAEC